MISENMNKNVVIGEWRKHGEAYIIKCLQNPMAGPRRSRGRLKKHWER